MIPREMQDLHDLSDTLVTTTLRAGIKIGKLKSAMMKGQEARGDLESSPFS
jgi:hypothetical protein